MEQRCKQLSYGQQRIIEVMLVLHSKAKYVLLDEPFNGIAPLHKEMIMERIRSQSLIKGIILTDHDYQHVLTLANRIVLIQNGAMTSIRSVDDLRSKGYLPMRKS